jgi:sulfur-oxidizing protein SoxX
MRAWVQFLALASIGAANPGFAGAAGLVDAYTITNGSEIAEKLTGATGAPGDAARGRALYAGEARAGCAVCHGVPGAVSGDAPAPGLIGVGGRLSPGAIRLWIVAPETFDPETDMPAFYAAGQRQGASDPLYGSPALTAAEIEDLVAYLTDLNNPD